MKKILLIMLVIVWCFNLVAKELILIEENTPAEIKQLLLEKSLKAHFYNDSIVIGTLSGSISKEYISLEENPWETADEYFIYYLGKEERNRKIETLSEFAIILHEDKDYLIIRVKEDNVKSLIPAVHGGVVRIGRNEAFLSNSPRGYGFIEIFEDEAIVEMLNQVDETILLSHIQNLENYGTRNCYQPESVEAQNWLQEQFLAYDLNVVLQDFSMPGGASTDNVIAYQPGILYPDEYVIVGGHYDSISNDGDAPGADDNASGTSAVLEIARVLSQYEFDRTIIYCAFSGEEYGLYGSQYFVQQAVQQGYNILGYFNLDMIGYLHPGNQILTHMIAPASAAELVNFYTNVNAVYQPDFIIGQGVLTGGDSDHTPFNNAGYMGIFPFEDTEHYSPYIHTSNDLIGPSMNSIDMASVFTKATMASVATMSSMFFAPADFSVIPGNGKATLSWSIHPQAEFYKIFREDVEGVLAVVDSLRFVDTDLTNGISYTYYITAVDVNDDESVSSDQITVTPLTHPVYPYVNNFESSLSDWTVSGQWGLSTQQFYSPSYSLADSPNGNYQANQNSSAVFRWIDLSDALEAEMSFMAEHNLESGYDYVYLEVSTDGNNWDSIASYNGSSDWTLFSYTLNDYIGSEYVLIRFRLYSDSYIQQSGIYIDDFSLNVELDPSGVNETPAMISEIKLYPNPFNPSGTISRGNVSRAVISFNITKSSNVEVDIFNTKGQLVNRIADSYLDSGTHSFTWSGRDSNGSAIGSGVYLSRIKVNGINVAVKKIVVLK
ncbi:MAG: M28 family peptidase [Candidatus Cloacimonetes bacterium]|nr:M28 family peptidase [Candidatus Cloacimonadota bacterium]